MPSDLQLNLLQYTPPPLRPPLQPVPSPYLHPPMSSLPSISLSLEHLPHHLSLRLCVCVVCTCAWVYTYALVWLAGGVSDYVHLHALPLQGSQTGRCATSFPSIQLLHTILAVWLALRQTVWLWIRRTEHERRDRVVRRTQLFVLC